MEPWNGYAILGEAMRGERWIVCGQGIRNGGTRCIDACLKEFGWERAGRTVIERAAGNADATMVFVPCIDEADACEPHWVVLLSLDDLRMLPYSIFEKESK